MLKNLTRLRPAGHADRWFKVFADDSRARLRSLSGSSEDTAS